MSVTHPTTEEQSGTLSERALAAYIQKEADQERLHAQEAERRRADLEQLLCDTVEKWIGIRPASATFQNEGHGWTSDYCYAEAGGLNFVARSYDRTVSLQLPCPRCGQLTHAERYGNYWGLAEIGGALAMFERHPDSHLCGACKEAEQAANRTARKPEPTPTQAEQLHALLRQIVREEVGRG